jgi:hypothetical protein
MNLARPSNGSRTYKPFARISSCAGVYVPSSDIMKEVIKVPPSVDSGFILHTLHFLLEPLQMTRLSQVDEE